MSVCRFPVRLFFHVAVFLLLRTLPTDGAENKGTLERRVERARITRLFGGKGWIQKPSRKWPKLDANACGQLSLPKEAMDRRRWDLEPPITSFDNFTIPGTRALLVYPRMGLGNTLRGYKSAFFYSIFSGRRLVFAIAGGHKKGPMALCKTFHCSVDHIMVENETETLNYKRSNLEEGLTSGGETNLVHNFHNNASVMGVYSSGVFNKYWFEDESRRNCLFSTLNCSTQYCANMRAMKYLIGGGPKDILGETIEDIIEGSVLGGRTIPPIPKNKGLRLSFDIAIHIRTFTQEIEGFRFTKECKAKNDCFEELQSLELYEQNKHHAYVSSNFWRCSKKYLSKLKESLANNISDPRPRLNIFLATDSEILRPIFAQKLMKHGVVYYSNGGVFHSSRGGDMEFPTMAEFFLLTTPKYLLSFQARISTFAEAAVEFGNVTTLFFDPKQSKCTFVFPYAGIGTTDVKLKISLKK